jgi:hypothetical protein
MRAIRDRPCRLPEEGGGAVLVPCAPVRADEPDSALYRGDRGETGDEGGCFLIN